jgi:hypothetical protein
MSALGRDPETTGLAMVWPVVVVAAASLICAMAGGRAIQSAGPARWPAPTEKRFQAAANEPLQASLLKAGLRAGDAELAVDALGDQIDAGRPGGGIALDLKAERAPGDPNLRLIDLVVTRHGRAIAALTRAADGAFRLSAESLGSSADDGAQGRPTVLQGPMEDILYGHQPSGPLSALVGQAIGLFARKLDLTRDVSLGDRVRLCSPRAPTPSVASLARAACFTRKSTPAEARLSSTRAAGATCS